MLFEQHFLLLGQFLELQVDVAGLGIVARLQAIDLDAKLGDTILIGVGEIPPTWALAGFCAGRPNTFAGAAADSDF
jgi:hypothetical protein